MSLDRIFTLCAYKLFLQYLKCHHRFSFLHLHINYLPCINHSNKWNIYGPFYVSLYVQDSYIIHICSIRKNTILSYKFTHISRRHKAWNFVSSSPVIVLSIIFVCAKKNIYRPRAIISRDLYIFTLFFSAVYNKDRLISQTIYVLNKKIWA